METGNVKLNEGEEFKKPIDLLLVGTHNNIMDYEELIAILSEISNRISQVAVVSNNEIEADFLGLSDQETVMDKLSNISNYIESNNNRLRELVRHLNAII